MRTAKAKLEEWRRDLKPWLRRVVCVVLGHNPTSKKRDQNNPKVVKYDLICKRCEEVTGTFTWPNLNFGRHREG